MAVARYSSSSNGEPGQHEAPPDVRQWPSAVPRTPRLSRRRQRPGQERQSLCGEISSGGTTEAWENIYPRLGWLARHLGGDG
jgi:hypothetical protein